MESKTYTAQEMREESYKLDEFCRVFEKKSRTPAMLRYAADVVERCEAEIAKLPYPPNADDVYMFGRLNYILRGDRGEGGAE